MTEGTKFPCATNPETGKPYTKHIHTKERVRYVSWKRPIPYFIGEPIDIPMVQYDWTWSCHRLGCTKDKRQYK